MTRTGWVMLGLFLLLGVAVVTMLGGQGPALGISSGAGAGAESKAVATPSAVTSRETAVAVDASPVVVASGLILPVAGVAQSALYDSWGDERGGGDRSHLAIDIPAPRGTPVLAAAAGRIEKLWQSEAGGTTLYIRSPTGKLSYYYAHLDSYAPGIREGLSVAAGQHIATVGDSGNAGAGNTHLHFGMSLMGPEDNWAGGRPVNPYPLLAGNGAGR